MKKTANFPILCDFSSVCLNAPRLLLQHILPKGFRCVRNFGFLHPNCKRQITLLQVLLRVQRPAITPTPRLVMICTCCGGIKHILQTRIKTRYRPNAKDVSMPDVNHSNKGIMV